MSTGPAGASCPVPSSLSWWGRLSLKLNTTWHKYALWAFGLVVLTHWVEHLAQAFEVYVLGWPLKDSFGFLGMLYPAMIKSELMHYLYAIVMLVLLWVLRKGFTGRSYVWWMIAFWIQFWHHVEHALLQGQVIAGHNFFGAPAPISLIQMLGFIEGPASTGFNGLMAGPPRHAFSALMLAVRRMEVHLFYNTIVFVPMAIGMYLHVFPSPKEEQHVGCTCSWHYKKAEPPELAPQGA
jgi:hypothetical protein